MQSYVVTYLLPRIEQADAVEVRGLPGQYRHRSVIAARRDVDVITEVRARGGVPLSIKPMQVRKAPAWMRARGGYRERLLQAVLFSVQSGMSATRSLQRALESDDASLIGPTQDALGVLRAGGGFGDAMRAIGVFDESTMAILESGERTGRMGESLEAALEHMNKRSAGTKAMVGAVGWTFFDLIFAVLTIIGLRYQLLPMLSGQKMEGANAQEQLRFTQTLEMAYVINDVLIIVTLLMIVFAAVGAWGHFGDNQKLRLRVDRVLRRVPGLGQAIEHNALSAGFTVAAAMLKGGVAFLSASEVASRASRFEPVQEYWRTAHERVINGFAVRLALRSSLLDASEMLLIGSHTTQKQLALVLFSIAEQRDNLALKASKQFAVLVFLASLIYSGVAVLFTLWVVYLQNSQMMSNLKVLG
jgi:type II secretory pathway component PulF